MKGPRRGLSIIDSAGRRCALLVIPDFQTFHDWEWAACGTSGGAADDDDDDDGDLSQHVGIGST